MTWKVSEKKLILYVTPSPLPLEAVLKEGLAFKVHVNPFLNKAHLLGSRLGSGVGLQLGVAHHPSRVFHLGSLSCEERNRRVQDEGQYGGSVCKVRSRVGRLRAGVGTLIRRMPRSFAWW